MPALIENTGMRRIARCPRSWIALLTLLLGIAATAPVAKANSILEYTGAPFSNVGLDCSQVECLTGNLTVEFHIVGNIPSISSPFCLSLGTLGTTSGNCLAVEMGLIWNGANTLLLEGSPNHQASFQLGSSPQYWLVYLDGFSNVDPPASQVLLSNGMFGGSEYMKYGKAVGRSNSVGSWSLLNSAVQDVPEPATWIAIATGLGLTGLLGRKRTQTDRVE